MATETQITYSKEFDSRFQYHKKDLGVTYTKEGSVFKIWSPLSDEVTLYLYENGGTTQQIAYPLHSEEHGVWSVTIDGDLHGTYYDYTIRRGDLVTRTADPYAKASNCNGYRSMVVDLSRTNPEGFEKDQAPERENEQIIYELHIKDFSYDRDSGIPKEYQGKYKAFTVEHPNKEYPTGVEYLKQLGVTHVHLLPFYDFGFTDEAGSDEQFNWGYDPVNYNVPEGSFATNPFDGAVRIKECKEMIQALHENGIRVVMDVVYNHTYEPDSWLERTVPGYYCRRNTDGSLSNGSACGNDIAVGRAMVDNYIADSVMYWAKEYHIDGFRFDLMGLLTVELMNRIRKELDEEFGAGEKLLYGEPWRAKESPMEEGTMPALKVNVEHLDEHVAMFSDDTRDAIKGDVFYEEKGGFVNGGVGLEETILQAVDAWRTGGSTGHPKSASQIINYISAHDNFTLWDKLVMSVHGGHAINSEHKEDSGEVSDPSVFTTKYEDIMAMNKLAALMYFTFQGHIFFQAGEEFGRTKLGDANSYRSHPTVNMLRWQQTIKYADLLAYYQGLIRLRKNLPGLYDKSVSAYGRISRKKVHGEGLVSFVVDNESAENACEWKELFIIYNANQEEKNVALPEGTWTVLADGQDTDCRKNPVLSKFGKLVVPGCSGMILAKSCKGLHIK